jgi:hypothetical protein
MTIGDFPDRDFDVVTGAFSYSGAAIARELERSGRWVPTLTGHPERAPASGGIGVLLNNIAWLLRHVPVFAIGGRGDYRIRGIHVDDLARLCLAKATETHDSVTDAVGPERPTFTELVRQIGDTVGSHTRLVHVPGVSVPLISKVLGLALHDVLLTGDEYRAMAAGLADTAGPATGSTALSVWLAQHEDTLGLRYANELARHFDRADGAR